MNLRDWLRPYPQLKRSIFNLKSGTALRAVMYKQAGPYLVLRSVEILADRGTLLKAAPPAAMDGEVLVRDSDVDFIQVLP